MHGNDANTKLNSNPARASCMEIYDEKMYDLLNNRKQVMMRSHEERGRLADYCRKIFPSLI